ncbi:uncharacterized protein LOC130694510 [Daphnia carinata]|uniref:uncharacterized protein LOC130694510 n=1 Tax=Daphnia carinata TaxID=120202 RepID=UPI00257DE26B|nr:uncharacterized protein LOC130694510 [Daphnia carinata]
MERSTTEGGSGNVTEDLENRMEFRPSLSGALERPLPTLSCLLMEYREAIEEKARYQIELDHEIKIADDMQYELNYYQTVLDHKTKNNQIPQLGVQQLCNIELIHKELRASIKILQEKLLSQQEEIQAAIKQVEKSAWEMSRISEQEFLQQMNQLEVTFEGEMEIVRQAMKRKEDELRTAKEKQELEHSKRMEEVRKSMANRMKSDSHHIECRSIELDFRKQRARLEKELKQLEQQQRSKRKLPLSFVASDNATERPGKFPNNSKGNNRNNGTLTPRPAQPGSAGKEPAENAPNSGGARKRKLFSVNCGYLDF